MRFASCGAVAAGAACLSGFAARQGGFRGARKVRHAGRLEGVRRAIQKERRGLFQEAALRRIRVLDIHGARGGHVRGVRGRNAVRAEVGDSRGFAVVFRFLRINDALRQAGGGVQDAGFDTFSVSCAVSQIPPRRIRAIADIRRRTPD